MCNTLQSFYTCFQQLDFFTLPKPEPSENFVGNKCFVIWVIFLLNEFLEVLKYESFKNLFLHVNFTCCQYYCQYFGQCYCQYCCWCCCQYCCQRYCWCYCQCYCKDMICTYLYNICVLKEKVCVVLICFNFSVLILYYWLWK